MRFLLALLLFAACSFFGFSKAKAVKRRLEIVEGFLLDIRQLSISMRYRMTPVKELIRSLSESTVSAFWQELLLRMEREGPLEEAWRAALKKLREDEFFSLTDAEARMLEDFGAGLGTSDYKAQKANMEMALERLDAQAQTLRQEVAQKGKIYRSLGMLGGLAAAILVW